jgi:hypothetical protein
MSVDQGAAGSLPPPVYAPHLSDRLFRQSARQVLFVGKHQQSGSS